MLEMVIKVSGYGLFIYFNNFWNILNFCISFTIFLNLYLFPKELIFNFGSFRLFNFVNLIKLKELETLIYCLLSTWNLLKEYLLIFISFSLIYATLGLHIFSGLLKYKCYNNAGIFISQIQNLLCGNRKCPENYFCAKSLDNIDSGISSFDNIFSSWLQVLRVISLNRWYTLMNSIQSVRKFTPAIIYFCSLSFFGNIFLVTLIIAILKVKYTESNDKFVKNNLKENYNVYDLRKIQPKKIKNACNQEKEEKDKTFAKRKNIIDKIPYSINIDPGNEEGKLKKFNSISKSSNHTNNSFFKQDLKLNSDLVINFHNNNDNKIYKKYNTTQIQIENNAKNLKLGSLQNNLIFKSYNEKKNSSYRTILSENYSSFRISSGERNSKSLSFFQKIRGILLYIIFKTSSKKNFLMRKMFIDENLRYNLIKNYKYNIRVKFEIDYQNESEINVLPLRYINYIKI